MKSEFENNMPIYLQIVEQIKMDIISGDKMPGERLPSVREWSLQNRVNPNTMQKALSELESLGLIYTERTNGKFVTEDKDLILRYRNDFAAKLAKQFFSQMNCIGFDKEEAIKYLENKRGEKK